MKINIRYFNSKNYSGANVIELGNICNCSWGLIAFGISQLSSPGPCVSGGVVAMDCVKITALITAVMSSCKMKKTVTVWVLRGKCFNYLPETKTEFWTVDALKPFLGGQREREAANDHWELRIFINTDGISRATEFPRNKKSCRHRPVGL